VNAPVDVVVPVSELVTTTSLAPALPEGVVQVIDVAETTVTDVQALPPTVTAAPCAKFVPVIVIDVPPAVLPEVGAIDVMVGDEIGAVEVHSTEPGQVENIELVDTYTRCFPVRSYGVKVIPEIKSAGDT
jgi:hypothetical protein